MQSKLEVVRSLINDIPADQIREPSMPVDVYIGEVQNTISAARMHWPRFVAINFPNRWLEQAEKGAAALAEAQAAWVNARDTGRPEGERALIETAQRQRAELLDTAGYVMRHDPASLTKLTTIREGEGLSDLAQDLKELGVLIESKRSSFEAIQFDFDLVRRARAISDELLQVHATNTVQKTLNDAKAVRDRVYSWTDQAVDELRAAGIFVLRNENRPDWLAMFRSRHALTRGRRSRGKTVASATAATNPTVPGVKITHGARVGAARQSSRAFAWRDRHAVPLGPAEPYSWLAFMRS